MALALACFGRGSMLSALPLPRIIERTEDRKVTLTAAGFLSAVLVGFAVLLFANGWSFAPAD
ncbi:hypothetical protein [Bosea sp. CRIB-10]|uniref:hypothetical protein n=1 Tax=Bosea sp. CRIB-10 TaxID=378404 RepID=UPI000B88D17F|nr:hypothetical protein [Bosea sp. CRIB-10]